MINVVESTSQNQIIVVPGANSHTRSEQMSDQVLSTTDILISQMEVESKEIEKLFLRAKDRNCYRILNAAPALTLSKSLFSNTDLFVVNEIELESLTKKSIQIDSLDFIKESIESMGLNNQQSIVVTLGSNGFYIHQNNKNVLNRFHKVEAI